MNSMFFWLLQEEIPSDPVEGKRVLELILQNLRDQHWDEQKVSHIHLTVEEAMTNAIKHGNHRDPNKKVIIVCKLTLTCLEVTIADQGEGFDPKALPDPRVPENLEKPSGRGVLLMNHFMDEVVYNEVGNQITLRKFREAA